MSDYERFRKEQSDEALKRAKHFADLNDLACAIPLASISLEFNPSNTEAECVLKTLNVMAEKAKPIVNHYRILGVNRNARDKEIESAYRKLQRFVHPDKVQLKQTLAACRAVVESKNALLDANKAKVIPPASQSMSTNTVVPPATHSTPGPSTSYPPPPPADRTPFRPKFTPPKNSRASTPHSSSSTSHNRTSIQFVPPAAVAAERAKKASASRKRKLSFE